MQILIKLGFAVSAHKYVILGTGMYFPARAGYYGQWANHLLQPWLGAAVGTGKCQRFGGLYR
ncbi:hypothetical protein GCM10023185_04850 [Hymenobacter saemangeumensis]|uniref:Uncharacterized protein n=1 Tax=Hymenobacter saemangeumensis TaxID=1084522 RepID=A0ABP8I0H2_9BACT